MRLVLDRSFVTGYKSASQKVRVLTERWVDDSIFCPNCGHLDIEKYPNNQPVADFFCSNCREDYELKSKKNTLGSKIVDGAYRTMLERLNSSNNPNFFLLHYGAQSLEILNFFVIPKHFFVPEIIERRNALAPSARRAGWIGCNIRLGDVPESGKIFFVRDRRVESKKKVLAEWQKTLFLRDEPASVRGWTLEVIKCVEKLHKKSFTLDEVYRFEDTLSGKYPGNKHIKDKIRQQLQVLRDKGYLFFVGRGVYKLA